MKNKLNILILIIGLLFITACNVVDDDNDNNEPEEIEIKYVENDLNNIYLTINDLDVTIDLSKDNHLKELLLSLKIYKNEEIDSSNNRTSKYVLSFGDYEFTIYNDETICYIDNENEYDYLYTLNNEFSYLDTVFEKDILDFTRFTDSSTIKVFNSTNDSVDITEKTEFLDKLKLVKFFKLNNKELYDIGNLKYKIQIDEDTINIYNKHLMINGNLYMVLDGDFSFLNSLKFGSSSGWLPWL